jgi:GWxTD domain-containing protein
MSFNNMYIIKLIRQYLFIISFLMISCKGPLKVTIDRNFADMYNPGTSRLHPDYNIYHSSEDTSDLLVKIFPVELLYNQDNKEGIYAGKVKIEFVMREFDEGNKNPVIDSGRYVYTFNREEASKIFIGRIPVKADTGKIYELKIKATDLVRKDENQRFLIVDKRSRFSQQNFMVLNGGQNILYFAPYVVGNNTFTIRYGNDSYSKVYISYYGRESPLPRPSFASASDDRFFEKPDSMWILPFNKDLKYLLEYRGIYHFRLDTVYEEGLTIFNFGESFPKINKPEQLVEPLAYLTSSSEYEELKSATNQKLAFDNFWLNKADNIEKARELIRIYFNRVYFANYYFTSYKAGWKTDRGMVYIIYGPPQALYRSNSQEKWLYYRKSITTSVTFTFDYYPSPYTVNNYILQRSESNEWHWREAIESWRRGKVFLLD